MDLISEKRAAQHYRALEAIDWMGKNMTRKDWMLWLEAVSTCAIENVPGMADYRDTMKRLVYGPAPGAVYVIQLAKLFGWDK